MKFVKFDAKVILVFCPKCEMLFYDRWKPPKFWKAKKHCMSYICPYCDAILGLDVMSEGVMVEKK